MEDDVFLDEDEIIDNIFDKDDDFDCMYCN
jgi:hypothetical protein